MALPKIAIIGAGPGGCMLARLLQTSNPSIPVTIFESEASVNYRSQGGTLDLRTNTGLAAVKAANLWDEFQKYARYDGESLLITDKNLTTWMRRNPRKNAKDTISLQEAPEIDRVQLRRILMECLPDSTVRWGFKLSRVEETASGLALHFVNGEVITGFDLIVGCDGAFSKTRKFLSSEAPFYAGLAGWALNIPNAATTAPEAYRFANRGSVFSYSDNKAFSLQQLGDGSLHVGLYGPYAEDFSKTCGFDVTNIDEAKKALRETMKDWKPEFLDAIEKSQGTVQWQNLYQLPVGFTWPHKAGVTLLGDAAHVMTPFAGIGLNTAFADAMMLSREILASVDGKGGSLDEHIKSYEREMLESAHKGMKFTQDVMYDIILKPGAPRTGIESWILRHAKVDAPRWSHPLLTAVVYVGYWVYKLFV